jgi:hypothetical protein
MYTTKHAAGSCSGTNSEKSLIFKLKSRVFERFKKE